MNGTVTMKTNVTGVEADTFEEAAEKLRVSLEHFGDSVDCDVQEGRVRYRISGHPFPVVGLMDSEPIYMLGSDV